jgi:CIC family chloride channel protein
VFLVFALTKNLLILKPLLVCAVASTVMASILHEQSIYKRQFKLMGTLRPQLPSR